MLPVALVVHSFETGRALCVGPEDWPSASRTAPLEERPFALLEDRPGGLEGPGVRNLLQRAAEGMWGLLLEDSLSRKHGCRYRLPVSGIRMS